MPDFSTAVCCFTGHRLLPDDTAPLRARLFETIEALYARGVTVFAAGGALGFDTLAAETVLALKEKQPEIRLCLVLPCRNQTKGWARVNVDRYHRILECCDEAVYIAEEYDSGCMHRRNRRLVDGSTICVCYLKKSTGGTGYTVNYARRKGLEIINLA